MVNKLNSTQFNSILNIESKEWTKDNIKSTIDKDEYYYFGYFKNDKLIAYYCIKIFLDICELNNIAVKKEHRRKNIGKLLIRHLIEFSKDKKCTKIELEVRKSNSNAIDLYLKNNFEIVGIRKNYYQNPEENALLMTLFL